MRKERGAALLLALGVVATVAVILSDVLMQGRLTMRAAENGIAQAQLRQVAIAGTQWAQLVLDDDARTTSADSLNEAWAVRLPPTPAEGGRIAGRIVDQQGLFNVNNLVGGGRAHPPAVAQFQRLLAVLSIDPSLADAVVDWLDGDDEMSGSGGAEGGFYARLDPPRTIANHTLVDVSELRAVRGVTPAVFDKLAPFVSALPVRTTVNINTAPPEVLVAVVQGLSLEDARALDVRRRTSPFLQRDAFLGALPSTVVSRAESDIDVSSRYFAITVEAVKDDNVVNMRTLVEREQATPTRVVYRSFQ
jgi:general secretion pathway protein K